MVIHSEHGPVAAAAIGSEAACVRDEDALRHARALLHQQANVITRQQALAAGLTSKAIRSRLAAGRWQRLQHGVYATFTGPPARAAQLWAAVLRAGPEAVLSHQTAAEIQGLAAKAARLIHVTVPSGARIVPPRGAMVHYSGRLDQARHPVLLPPRTRLEETVLDLVDGAATLDEAVSILAQALGKRLTTAPLLLGALETRTRLRRRPEVARALGIAGEGTHSLLEFRYVTRVERPHNLPTGIRQRRVRRAGRRQYQDVAYDGYQTVVELDGQVAHPEAERWRDTRRDNLNAAYGLATIRLGYADVTERPCHSAALIGRALVQRGWTGSLRRCGRDCVLPAKAAILTRPLTRGEG